MNHVILTGTPGAGKTTLIRALAAQGHAIVTEAATDVIAQQQAVGIAEPWLQESFIDDIVALQRERQLGSYTGTVRFYDRSPICTLALSRYLRREPAPGLQQELQRIDRDSIYARKVFFIANLGFCEATPARQISYADSLVFEQVHLDTYRSMGYDCVIIPPLSVAERVQMIRTAIRVASEE